MIGAHSLANRCASVEAGLEQLHAHQTQVAIGEAVELNHAQISRRIAAHHERDLAWTEQYTIKQGVGLLTLDRSLLGRLVAATLSPTCDESMAVLGALRQALATATACSDAMSPTGRGGTTVTRDEAAELVETLHELIAVAAQTVAALEMEV